MNVFSTWVTMVLSTIGIVVVVFLLPLMRNGQREYGSLETIHGIPFPHVNSSFVVDTKLAHMDVYLREPVLAKALTLTIFFTPDTDKPLYIGVRENPFWLSYTWHRLYTPEETREAQPVRKNITIPLTNMLQEPDRSIDVMFLAASPDTILPPDEGLADTTAWQLHSLEAVTTLTRPSQSEVKDYIRSIIYSERAV